jgi:hypothetical protein
MNSIPKSISHREIGLTRIDSFDRRQRLTLIAVSTITSNLNDFLWIVFKET